MVKIKNNDNSGKSKKSAQTPPELSSLKNFHQATIFLTTPFLFSHGTFCTGPHLFTAKLFLSVYYSRSQNNVNVVYCNYKETHSSYNVIAERNSPQSLPNVSNILKMFV